MYHPVLGWLETSHVMYNCHVMECNGMQMHSQWNHQVLGWLAPLVLFGAFALDVDARTAFAFVATAPLTMVRVSSPLSLARSQRSAGSRRGAAPHRERAEGRARLRFFLATTLRQATAATAPSPARRPAVA